MNETLGRLSNDAKEEIDIVLVTFNRLEFLKSTIKKIRERTRWPYRLIVVDNNSFDGTQDWLKYSGEVNTYICLSENKGLAGAMIEGFHLVDSEYFVFTQDDVWPPDLQPCWLERMLGLFKRNENKFVGISMVINKQPL